jgi:hypothetical protein
MLSPVSAAVSAARTAADRIASADSGSGLDRAAAEFIDALRGVPHQGIGGLAPADYEELRTIAERVIDRIEDRLAAHHDRASTQRDLAAAIYRIRAELEQIDRWQRYHSRRENPDSGRAP